MNLRNLTDTALVEKTTSLAKDERLLLTTILQHLREINDRRLYSAYGYKSLFEMAVKHFEYSEDAAYRRIAAMRVLAALPAVEEKINSGEINVTHLSMAQTHFRQERKLRNQDVPLEEQAALIEELAGQSVREAEKTVMSHSSAPREAKPDRVKTLSEDFVFMQFMAAAATLGKIDTLKGWLAHQHPQMRTGELFAKLCDLGLQEWDPRKTAASRKRRVKKEPSERDVTQSGGDVSQSESTVLQDERNGGRSARNVTQSELDGGRLKCSAIKSEHEAIQAGSNFTQIKRDGRKFEFGVTESKPDVGIADEVQPPEINEENANSIRLKTEDLSPNRDDIQVAEQKSNGALHSERGSHSKVALQKGVTSEKSAAPLNPRVAAVQNPTINKRPIIRAEVRRFVYTRANNRCELCGSSHACQIDHIILVAWGGTSEPENLRLLCRSCNQRAAIENLGLEKMARHLQH